MGSCFLSSPAAMHGWSAAWLAAFALRSGSWLDCIAAAGFLYGSACDGFPQGYAVKSTRERAPTDAAREARRTKSS